MRSRRQGGVEKRVDIQAVENLLAPILSAQGAELVQVAALKEHGRPTLRVLIDTPDGVRVADCARVNRVLRDHEGLLGLIGEEMDIEVSSPGVDRPLRRLSDYERFIGQRTRVVLRESDGSKRQMTGRLCAVEGELVRLEVGGSEIEVSFSSIIRGNLKPTTEELFAAHGLRAAQA